MAVFSRAAMLGAGAPLVKARPWQNRDQREGDEMAEYQEARPASLHGFVDRIWFGPRIEQPVFQILPDGCVDVVFLLSEASPGIQVFGTTTTAVSYLLDPSTDYLGIRFRPGHFARYWGDRLDGLTNTHERRREMLGLTAEALLEQPDFLARCRMLETALRGASDRFVAHPLVLGAVSLLEHGHGRPRIEAVARQAGVSRRHLERRFLEEVGVSPKRFARIVRFHAALDLLARRHASLDVAFSLGYYDQSHLLRELRALGGGPTGAP